MHINEYKLIQKEIDEQNISIVDYAKKHGIKLGTLYRGLQNVKKYGEPIRVRKLNLKRKLLLQLILKVKLCH